ncbi:transketolase [Streptantibioticus silvisoli]|uniref:Transketolase n=1 Tax=Streptantibioticus silvisoli TaxID=2705255 RepID=A0ABT6VSD1_9ACTN|nr:transketolase [Streptantibioticus silvisoli]MDI5961388.1 transketolase [Streptantibioticus silvisoli]
MFANASDELSDAPAALAARARRRLLDLAVSRPVHLGASLSVVDILVAVHRAFGFTPARSADPDRHRLVLSKGHSVWALYCVLAELGMPGLDDPRAGHPLDGTPGVEAATGALGHGLSIGAGLAEAARLDGSDRRTAVVLGDGELNEGSVWEAAMFAAHRRLGNLVAVVDRNTLQQEGPTEQVLALEPLAAKWESFGWRVAEVDGHDCGLLVDTLTRPSAPTDRPTVLVAHTVKGRGVPYMEGEPRFHHLQLTERQHREAVAALDPRPAVAR